MQSRNINYKFARGIFACKSRPLVYMNMPKCACTTIKNIMYEIDHGLGFERPLDIHKQIAAGNALVGFHQPEKLKASISGRQLSFTFVRHPLKRSYSCFNEKIYQKSQYSFKSLRDGYLKREYGISFPAFGALYTAEQHAENFKKFLIFVRDNMAGNTEFRQDPHWLPQTMQLERYFKYAAIDFIGRIEKYAADMDFVLASVGVADRERFVQLKFNEGDPPPYSYKEIMTDEILRLGSEVYESDFVKLAYQP